MAAILRVKRRNTDTPLDTLVIACKRPKTEASHSDAPTVQTVAQFAGTLTDPTEDVTKHVAKVLPKINVEKHKTGVKRMSDDNDYPTNISGKVPKWIDVNSVAEKYKIIDQQSLDTTNEEKSKDNWMMLIDVEDCWSISRLTNQAAKEDIEDYVYDLYYAQTCDDIWFESNSILVQQPEYSDVDFEDEDESSDSNAESHWRNDYPDTDPDRSKDDDASSDDNFDIYDDDDDLYGCRKDSYRYNYGRRHILESKSDLSDDEDSSYNEETSSNEVKSTDNEEISDNEGMENV